MGADAKGFLIGGVLHSIARQREREYGYAENIDIRR